MPSHLSFTVPPDATCTEAVWAAELVEMMSPLEEAFAMSLPKQLNTIFPLDDAAPNVVCALTFEQKISPDDEASAEIVVATPFNSTVPDELAQSDSSSTSTDASISADDVAFIAQNSAMKAPLTLADDEASMPTFFFSARFITISALDDARRKSLLSPVSVGLICTFADARLSMRDSFSFLGMLTVTLRLP